MALVEVFGDIFGDGRFALAEGIEIARAELGGDFVADVEQLAKVRIVGGIFLIVSQCGDVLCCAPGVDFGCGGELGAIDVDNRGVGSAKLVDMIERAGVDFLDEFQAGGVPFGQADKLFEPGGPGGFDVQTGTVFGDGAADRSIDGEFIAAGMDAEFQVGRQAVLLDGEGDDGQVVAEFLFELSEVADVVDAFVETPGEFGGDGLERDFFVGQRREDDKQLGGRLRLIGFIHRNFGDEITVAFKLGDVAIDFSGFLHGEQEFAGDALDIGGGGGDGSIDARDRNVADQLGMIFDERRERFRIGGLADGVGDIDSVEIGMGHEAIDGFEADMIGVDVIGLGPVEGFDGGVGGGAGTGRFRADRDVFAIGFIPNWHDGGAMFGSQDAARS